MDTILFNIGTLALTIGHVLGVCFIVILGIGINHFLNKKLIGRYLAKNGFEVPQAAIVQRMVTILISLFVVLFLMNLLSIDQILFTSKSGFIFKISHILQGLVILQLARLLDWGISNIFIHRYFSKRDDNSRPIESENTDQENSVNKIVQYIVYALAIIYLLGVFNIDYTLIQREFNNETVRFRISGIFISILIFLIAQLVVWVLTQLVLYGIYRNRKIDVGAQYAINQLLRYVIYVIATVIVLDNLGINITILLGGAAALLVGIGLGLQQTFNDFISGIVLLFERTVSVGDVLQTGSTTGIVKKIGLRASTIETRGNISVLVPNSKLVNESVINWTHFDDKTRFDVDVGVSYNSDPELVKKILLDIANENPYIIKYPSPMVRLNNFGDSSLDFTLYFFSRNFIVIEDIKSDIRFKILEKFKENNIEIPFPQMDVSVKKS